VVMGRSLERAPALEDRPYDGDPEHQGQDGGQEPTQPRPDRRADGDDAERRQHQGQRHPQQVPHKTPPLTTALGEPRPLDGLDRRGTIFDAAHRGAQVEGDARGLIRALLTGDDRPPHHRLRALVGEGLVGQPQPGEAPLAVFAEDQPALGDDLAAEHRDPALPQEPTLQPDDHGPTRRRAVSNHLTDHLVARREARHGEHEPQRAHDSSAPQRLCASARNIGP
jgi:hypothetical protein